jgi:retinol dehydrogenase-12
MSNICAGVCKITKDLTGQVVIITGGNTGIGKETARTLAKMNATIILACRDPKRALPVVDELKNDTKNLSIEFMQLDLSDLSSIRKFTEEFKNKYQQLNILINNAGVMAIPERNVTKDGFEMQFGTNHLGHFYLTNLLLEVIERSAPSRIINLSSRGHTMCNKLNWEDIMYEKNYAGNHWQVYGQSKLANILFTKKLQQKLENKNVKVVSLHPGVVQTELARHVKQQWFVGTILFLAKPLYKNAVSGAQTSLQCALEDHDKLAGGMYYSDCKVKKESKAALSQENADRLWTLSEELIEKALQK